MEKRKSTSQQMDSALANKMMDTLEKLSARLDALEVKDNKSVVSSSDSSNKKLVEANIIWDIALTKARLDITKSDSATVFTLIKALYSVEPERLRILGELHTDEDGLGYYSASFNIGAGPLNVIVTMHLYGAFRYNNYALSHVSVYNGASREMFSKCVTFSEYRKERPF